MFTEATAIRSVPGRRIRVAVVDSGIHARHPHVQRIAGGVAIEPAGGVSGDCADRIGHGTAVAAAIREKAPDAELYAVRIFAQRLATRIETLIAGIDWAVASGMHLINLSLGTANVNHRQDMERAICRATEAGAIVVSARDDEGVQWLPGCLPGVVPVQVDWTCPRETFRVGTVDGAPVLLASGFARPVPGVHPTRNLNGVSFAVANVTGFLARVLSEAPAGSAGEAIQALLREPRAEELELRS